MAKDLAIILNNGSLNSAVVTALAVQKFRPILVYSETAPTSGTRQRNAYDLQVAHFKPYREHTVSMPFLAALPGSGLPSSVNDPRAPTILASGLVAMLPLIAIASRFAVHYEASAIYIGLRAGTAGDELAQASEYIQVWTELLQLPCHQPELLLETPLLEMEPWQVVEIATQINAPLEKTWSCMETGNEPCGVCRGCRQRDAAFTQAAKSDPLKPMKR
jgi:7-cyano-7-deazaguanine synthase